MSEFAEICYICPLLNGRFEFSAFAIVHRASEPSRLQLVFSHNSYDIVTLAEVCKKHAKKAFPNLLKYEKGKTKNGSASIFR
jgi:hypothetical protein